MIKRKLYLILIFLFFRQSLRGCNSTKLTTMVDFPVYGFDMTPHLANKRNTNLNNHTNESETILQTNNGGTNGWSSPWKRTRKCSTTNDNMYDLYAVCYHHGSDLETGHYTAACKNPYDNQWYLYDDANVVNLSKETNDINTILVNNSAYILFYQKRNGIYVGTSSNTSSAASTSSVGSSNQDHWVARMPKFTPPKNLKTTTIATNNINNKTVENESNQTLENDNKIENNVKENDLKAVDDVVALRNSQNTLNSSCNNVRKSLETKTSEMNVDCNDSCVTVSQNLMKKPMFTTSIYINSSGNVDIKTTNSRESPVLSTHRINGVANDDINMQMEKTYTTTASVHRYSDSKQLDWVK